MAFFSFPRLGRAAVVAVMLGLAGCGQSGPLELPEGVEPVTPAPSSQAGVAEGTEPEKPFILDGLLQ